jgi:hypothetical protein
MRINWKHPEPRQGLAGVLDRFVGPGATKGELFLQFTFALLMSISVILYAHFNNLGWSVIQHIVAALIAFDLAGGIVTNATASAKRWYIPMWHKTKWCWTLIATNIFAPFLVAWVFRSMDWFFGMVVYSYAVIAPILLLKVPLHLQRPTAFILFCGAMLTDIYLFKPIPGLEWFLPFYFMKVILSQAIREEPYRPDIKD